MATKGGGGLSDLVGYMGQSGTRESRAHEYAHAKLGRFYLEAPQLHNPYDDHPLLDRSLRRLLPPAEYERTSSDLRRFGKRIPEEIWSLARQCEVKQPRLETHDPWGRRADKLIVCDEWKKLKGIMAEEGLIAIGYDESRDAVHRRIHQTAKLLMYTPASGLTGCPLAMTDGCVKTFRAMGLHKSHPEVRSVIERLMSTDASKAWTAGQWMTEKGGGSDVAGGCDTHAIHVGGDQYRLYGYKWFSSAADSNVALTLARIVDSNNKVVEGTKGISLFLLHVRNPDQSLNGIEMVRLKDKLGTRQVPTAELLLDGVKATLLSEPGRGIANISSLLNVTRLYNAAGSVGGMRAMLMLARDYSTRRKVFGQLQGQWPLHTRTLAEMEVDVRGCEHLIMDVARLIGLQEAGRATVEEGIVMRLLTPVMKAYTAKMAMGHISECLECFGGMGYLEDTGLPIALRDAQVGTIWEGTTNVLSLDVLRVMAGHQGAVPDAFKSAVEALVAKAQSSSNPKLKCAKVVVDACSKFCEDIVSLASTMLGGSTDTRIDAGAREILFSIARIYISALVVQSASYPDATPMEVATAERWCLERNLLSMSPRLFTTSRIDMDRELASISLDSESHMFTKTTELFREEEEEEEKRRRGRREEAEEHSYRCSVMAAKSGGGLSDLVGYMGHSGTADSHAHEYAHAKLGRFFLEAPQLHNPYADNPILDRSLRRVLPKTEYERTSADLRRFGKRIVDEIYPMARQCEIKQPRLETHDPWGRRADKLVVCDEWMKLKGIMAEEGLVAIGYDESRDAVYRRIHQTAKILMYSPLSGLTSCPLSFTDGCLKTFRALGVHKNHPEVRGVIERLMSTDSSRAWTAGQWMTEKGGGSDVAGGCDTYAIYTGGDQYLLYGYKWFSSAADSNVAMTLARIVDSNNKVVEGTKGISLFLLHVRNPDQSLNGIEMVRLKDKLGSRQTPTAELLLDGVKATLLGEPGRGIANISNMVNVTRLHNAAGCIGGMRMMLLLARDYSTRRKVFGRLQGQWPLHTRTLAEMEVEVRGCEHLILDVARLIGLQESGRATVEEGIVMRLLTPVLKAYTAKVAVAHISECLECFGGMGYLEDTGLPTALRDVQVATIWEGTTNVLSLDVLRVMAGHQGAVPDALMSAVEGLVEKARGSSNPKVKECAEVVVDACSKLCEDVVSLASAVAGGSADTRKDAGAREILFSIARVYISALVVQSASYPDATPMEVATAERWFLECFDGVVNVGDPPYGDSDGASSGILSQWPQYDDAKIAARAQQFFALLIKSVPCHPK